MLLTQNTKDPLNNGSKWIRKHKVGFAVVCGFLFIVGASVNAVRHFVTLGETVPLVDIAVVFALVGVGVGLLVYLAMLAAADASPVARERIDTVFKVTTPVALFAYFIYQVVAGALFATTSVRLELEKGDTNPKVAVVKVTLERGDNWLVRIEKVGYTTSPVVPTQSASYTEILFPGRDALGSNESDFSLAPKETTSTMFQVPLAADETYVTVRVVSYATLWPMPSRSYARILITRPTSHGGDRRTEVWGFCGNQSRFSMLGRDQCNGCPASSVR